MEGFDGDDNLLIQLDSGTRDPNEWATFDDYCRSSGGGDNVLSRAVWHAFIQRTALETITKVQKAIDAIKLQDVVRRAYKDKYGADILKHVES